ncbi:MAG: ABC transporter permease [Armatimonadetes bacterium]|nr:ABC transporter permease [Armatimonadota bacterium]
MPIAAETLPRVPSAVPGWERARRVVRRHPLAVFGGLVLGVLVAVVLLPGVFATHDPFALRAEDKHLPPSRAHWFGTDELGRDIYSRVVYGTRLSLLSALGVVALSSVSGTLLGVVAGYQAGVFDMVAMRLADIFISFPALIMAMAIVSFFGPTLVNAMLAIACIWWPQYARLVRGQVLSVREHPYIEAAVSTGASRARILLRHILPNSFVPVFIKATLDFGYAILLTASLSFLGLGAQPPSPELGALVTAGRVYLLTSWWYATFPGLVIFLAVLGLNLVGDGVRDLLDPALRGE